MLYKTVFLEMPKDSLCYSLASPKNVFHKLQNSEMKKGTLMSMSRPWNMAMGTISLPEVRMIVGRATSTDVTPAAEMGANLPK